VGEVALAGHFEWLPGVWKVSGPLAPSPSTKADALTDEELETHTDLGIAYAEMGLLSDALREVALVLSQGAGSRSSVQALDLFFGKHLAHPGAVSELRRRLFPS
jgi:hypothetical protein